MKPPHIKPYKVLHARIYLHGETDSSIAEKVGLSQQQMSTRMQGLCPFDVTEMLRIGNELDFEPEDYYLLFIRLYSSPYKRRPKMNYSSLYTQKDLTQKVKPRHTGGYRLDLQVNNVRKTFYSSKIGDAGRRECAKKALAWIGGSSTKKSYTITTDKIFQDFFHDKETVTDDIYNLKNYYKNHIFPIIGEIPVLSLTKQDLRRVINTAYKSGLSEKTLKNIRGVLSSFCFYLDDSDIRNDLSARSIKIPKGAKKSHKQILSSVGIYQVFTCDNTFLRSEEVYDDLINAYRLGIACGLRPGEIMGLQWGDITDDTIHIQRAINEKGRQTSGKNEFADRLLPQTKYTRALFASQAAFVGAHASTERVFGDYSEITYRFRFKRYCEHNGIDYVTPYELRHTFASIAIKPLYHCGN